MMEVLAAGKNPAEENSRIYRRYLGVEHPVPGFRVGEVVEESAVIGQFSPQEAQRHQNAGEGIDTRDEPALLANTQSREAEARRCDASRTGLIESVNITAILDHASIGIPLFPEKKETDTLQVVQELVIRR